MDLCAFHVLTGLPCPGCGLTRGLCALAHGQVYEAWAFHPFAFPLFAGTLVGLASPLLAPRFPALAGPRARRMFRVAALAFAIALALFGIWRAKRQWDQSTSNGPHPAKISLHPSTRILRLP